MEDDGITPPPVEGKRSAAAPPDLEVVAKPMRRRFTAQYKQRILNEAAQCSGPGEVGRLLRQEGLYSSLLTQWRRSARKGSLSALSQKRGRKPERNPLADRVRKLERQNARLEEKLRKAHLIIDVQGKVARLLGSSPDEETSS
jgi:transposase-like protein